MKRDICLIKELPRFDNSRANELLDVQKEIKANIEGHRKNIMMYMELLDFKHGMKILDVGCGLGLMPMELANQGAECIGLETVKEYASLLTSCGRYFKINSWGICGDACYLPFKDESFDAVMSKSFFEHVFDVDLALSEQVRVLKKGGRLIIMDGNFLCPKTLFDLLIRYPIRTKGKYGGIKWLLTKNEVRELYDGMFIGRDEDVKTVFWWKRRLRQLKNLKVLSVTTTYAYKNPDSILTRFFEPFLGAILAVAVKKSNLKEGTES